MFVQPPISIAESSLSPIMLASESPSIGPAMPQPLNSPPAAQPSPQATSSLQQGSSQAGSQQSTALLALAVVTGVETRNSSPWR